MLASTVDSVEAQIAAQLDRVGGLGQIGKRSLGLQFARMLDQLKAAEALKILRSKLRRIFNSQGTSWFIIRSLTPRQATGNALATEFIREAGAAPSLENPCAMQNA